MDLRFIEIQIILCNYLMQISITLKNISRSFLSNIKICMLK